MIWFCFDVIWFDLLLMLMFIVMLIWFDDLMLMVMLMLIWLAFYVDVDFECGSDVCVDSMWFDVVLFEFVWFDFDVGLIFVWFDFGLILVLILNFLDTLLLNYFELNWFYFMLSWFVFYLLWYDFEFEFNAILRFVWAAFDVDVDADSMPLDLIWCDLVLISMLV